MSELFADESEITSLPEGTDQIILTPVIADKPANYAVCRSTLWHNKRTFRSKRRKHWTKSGLCRWRLSLENDIEIIGDPNPDWNAGLSSSFSYKGLTLSANLLYRHGGDIFSQPLELY